MTIKQLTKAAPAASEDEDKALRTALANNYPANFDAFDVVRLIIYRRAVRAGVYNEGQGPHEALGMPAQAVPCKTWAVNGVRKHDPACTSCQ